MNPEDKVCYCYHVSLRKLLNFARREQPERPSQMSECLSAGTGCGWCIPILKKIAADPDRFHAEEVTPQEYEAERERYIKTKQPRNTF